MIIADTNVISNLMSPQPDSPVARWARFQPPDELFTTAVSEAEVRYGVARLPSGARREELHRAADQVFRGLMRGRILPFDSEAAQRFAGIMADRRRAGHRICIADAQIAGIVASHGATLATRNTGDFHDCGIPLINPWETA